MVAGGAVKVMPLSLYCLFNQFAYHLFWGITEEQVMPTNEIWREILCQTFGSYLKEQRIKASLLFAKKWLSWLVLPLLLFRGAFVVHFHNISSIQSTIVRQKSHQPQVRKHSISCWLLGQFTAFAMALTADMNRYNFQSFIFNSDSIHILIRRGIFFSE